MAIVISRVDGDREAAKRMCEERLARWMEGVYRSEGHIVTCTVTIDKFPYDGQVTELRWNKDRGDYDKVYDRIPAEELYKYPELFKKVINMYRNSPIENPCPSLQKLIDAQGISITPEGR